MKKGRESDGKRLKRILKLHQLLRGGKHFSTEQLQEAYFEATQERVELKTLQNDLRFMKNELHAPLPQKANKHEGYYYKNEESYSILEALDDGYFGTLNEAIALLRQASKSKEFIGLEDILIKLEQRVAVTDAERSVFIQFEEVELKGREYLPKVHQAILKKKPLRIDYQPFNEPEAMRYVFPLLLKEYNNRWFLMAWEENKSERPQIFALDRINNLRETALSFSIPKQTNWQAQFEQMIGVTLKGSLETVVLRFSENRFPYVMTKKLHQSQQLIDDRTISIQVYTNPELTAKILEFGADIEVLTPPILREEIKEILQKTIIQYK